jgi:hypothetical protein
VGEAIQNRPELADLRLPCRASQKFESAEHDLKRPNTTLPATVGALPYIDQSPRVAPEGCEGAAVNVDIPIFNGHLFTAREQAAHYDVRVAWLSASTPQQRIPVTVALVAQSQLSLTPATGRYNLGLASIVEITQVQLNVTQAQIENVTAGYESRAPGRRCGIRWAR